MIEFAFKNAAAVVDATIKSMNVRSSLPPLHSSRLFSLLFDNYKVSKVQQQLRDLSSDEDGANMLQALFAQALPNSR